MNYCERQFLVFIFLKYAKLQGYCFLDMKLGRYALLYAITQKFIY